MPEKKSDEALHLAAKDLPWRCKCGFLLGVVSPDKNVLRIKYKDLYLAVSGTDVRVVELCRRCAAPNEITSDPNDAKVSLGTAKVLEKPITKKAPTNKKS